MPWITKEGRTVDEARDAAIESSGLPVESLDVEVVNEGAKGLFGLGGEPAVVRVRPKDEATDFRHAFRDDITPARDDDATTVVSAPSAPAAVPAFPTSEESKESEDVPEVPEVPEEDRAALLEQQEQAAALGAEIVKGILDRLDLHGEIKTRIAGGTVYVEVFGDEMGILIGRSGATLEALQEIVRAGVQRRLKTRQALVVDVESYWDRRRRPAARGNEGGERGERGERKGSPDRGRGGRSRRGRRGGRGGRGATGGPTREEPDGNR